MKFRRGFTLLWEKSHHGPVLTPFWRKDRLWLANLCCVVTCEIDTAWFYALMVVRGYTTIYSNCGISYGMLKTYWNRIWWLRRLTLISDAYTCNSLLKYHFTAKGLNWAQTFSQCVQGNEFVVSTLKCSYLGLNYNRVIDWNCHIFCRCHRNSHSLAWGQKRLFTTRHC